MWQCLQGSWAGGRGGERWCVLISDGWVRHIEKHCRGLTGDVWKRCTEVYTSMGEGWMGRCGVVDAIKVMVDDAA